MIHPLPSGTRDVLPAEMQQRRAITDAMRTSFLAHGFGEIETPAIEYDEVVRRGGMESTPGYRVFDDHGAVLALRTDMTVPIARVVATRYATAEPPLRFSYLAHAYRTVRPHRGQMREFLQAGVELVGVPAPEGTAEVLRVMCAALDAAGLRDYRIGLGDAALYPALLDAYGAGQEAKATILRELGDRDFVGLKREILALDQPADVTDLLLRIAQRRGGADVLDAVADHPPSVAAAAGTLSALLETLEPEISDRIVVDLGVTRDLRYYTGPVFEVYAPGVGAPLGGGGHYDELVGRFGRDLPAVGFAVAIDRLQEALAHEEASA
jgi:ATP phosphoribosyltransferase regulatory subunit